MCDTCGVLGEKIKLADYLCPKCSAWLEDPNALRFMIEDDCMMEIYYDRDPIG